MVKAIRMPDLHQFKPGFFDLSVRCGGWELEHLIIVREAFLPHGCLRLWQGSVAEAGDWLHFRMVPVPLLATVSRRIRRRPPAASAFAPKWRGPRLSSHPERSEGSNESLPSRGGGDHDCSRRT